MATQGTRPLRSNNPRMRSQTTSGRGRGSAQGGPGLNRRGRAPRGRQSSTTRGRGAAQQQTRPNTLQKPSDAQHKEPGEHPNPNTAVLADGKENTADGQQKPVDSTTAPATSETPSSSENEMEDSGAQAESSAGVSESGRKDKGNIAKADSSSGSDGSSSGSGSGSDDSDDSSGDSSPGVREGERKDKGNIAKDDSSSGSSGSDDSDDSSSDASSATGSNGAESVQQSADKQSADAEQDQETTASTDQTPTETNGSTASIMVRLNASEPLPDHGLAAPANAFDQSLGDDDQSPVGHGTAADLAVLDYMSDRVLNEVSSADLLIKSSSVTSLPGAGHSDPQSSDIANVAMRRLDCLAREHALFRQNHFTRGLFLDSNHRPSDELSTERWCMSLARINFATFALLIFRPQAVVVEAVAQNMPNHGRVVASLGLKAATRAFFEHIVPVNKRNADTLRLLVDMQTQMWLLAADDEASLQETIAIERGTSTDSIKTLLAIDPDSGFSDDGIQRFDTRGVTMYQSEVNRRLSKISGGKLNITRSQYPLDNLWMSLSKYCIAEVADKPPCVIRQALSEKEPEDSDLDLADDDIGDDLRIDEPAYADTLSGSQQMPVDGDFEITILKEPKGKDAAVPTASATVINQVHDVDIPIDPSFSEERRVALLLKDALSDNHLDALLSKIEAEPIDTLQTRMRTRMSERIRPVRMEQAPEMANNSADDDDDDGFRLQIDESDDGWDVGGSGDRDANEPTRHAPSPVHTRSQGKRRRVYSEREDYSVESSDEERIINGKVPRTKPQRAKSYRDLSESEEAASVQQILDVITGTPRSKGMRYSPLKLSTSVNGGFQGRRGIAAEDISDLARSHSPVRFTQSSDEYSGPDDANGDESEAEGARRLVPTTSAGEEDAAERLGQYRPIQRAQEESDNEYDEYDDGAGASNHKLKARRVSRKTKKQTQHRTRWTRAEEECFVRAMHEYGNGWTAILSEHGVNGTVDRVLAKRNRENLKDKARNIKIRLMREGKPLGPFSNACGHL